MLKHRTRVTVPRVIRVCNANIPKLYPGKSQAIGIKALADGKFFAQYLAMGQSRDKLATRLDSLILALQEVANALRSVQAQVPPDVAAKIAKYRAESRCLFCGEPLQGDTRRGCHQVCYNKINRRIKDGELTTAQAVANGWFNPVSGQPGRKAKRPDPMRPSIAAAKAAIATARRDKRRDKKGDG